jgi:hypothetical protein
MDPREVRKLPQAEQDRIMSEAAKLVELDRFEYIRRERLVSQEDANWLIAEVERLREMMEQGE